MVYLINSRELGYFVRLTFVSRYHQLKIKANDYLKLLSKKVMAIIVFLAIPFGLTNVPAAFIDMMNKIFKKYLDKLQWCLSIIFWCIQGFWRDASNT